MKVLFVCTQDQIRSRTVEMLYGGRPDLEVRSACIAPRARVAVTEELLQWAETTFVMDEGIRLYLQNHFASARDAPKRIVCLDVPDALQHMSPVLAFTLSEKLRPYLGDPDFEL